MKRKKYCEVISLVFDETCDQNNTEVYLGSKIVTGHDLKRYIISYRESSNENHNTYRTALDALNDLSAEGWYVVKVYTAKGFRDGVERTHYLMAKDFEDCKN